jgi:phosphoglycerol transferase
MTSVVQPSAVQSRQSGLARPRSALGHRSELVLVILTVATVLGVLCVVLKLWRADLGIPFAYTGDATFSLSVIKNVIDNGWYTKNPHLGAPFGQELYDFPLGSDNLNVLLVRGLSVFSSSPAVVFNLFFLLTFPLVALTALLVLRQLGVSRGPAYLAAVLFVFLPFHFFHGPNHLFLSAYYAVPLGTYLILAVLGEKALFTRRESGRGSPIRRYATPRSLATLLMCVVIGSSGLYYASFTLLLIAIALLSRILLRRPLASFAAGTAVLVVIAATLLVNDASSIAYVHEHGRDSLVAQRHPQETEAYSLKLAYLLLPVDGHRLSPFARLKRHYDTTTPLPENQGEAAQTLGLLGTIGFAWLLFAAFASMVASSRPLPSLHRHTAAANIAAVLLATTGGISTLIAYLVSAQLRAWGRMSIFIGFFSLLAFALLLDAAGRRFATTRRGAWMFRGCVVVLLVFGVADQTTNLMVPPYKAVTAAWRNDSAFVHDLESRLPRDAAVYQVPYVPFPESEPPGLTQPYDPLRLYLHSDRLRWSAGAMKGRPADWQSQLAASPVPQQVPAVAAAGFSGILIDRFGYADGAASIESALRGFLGESPIVSADGRLSFFDLRPYAAHLRSTWPSQQVAALRTDTLQPVRFDWKKGFYDLETNGETIWYWSGAPEMEIELNNPARTSRPVRFHVFVRAAKGSKPLEIRFPDGRIQRIVATTGGVQLDRELRVAPGQSSVRISTAGPGIHLGADPRVFYLQFVDPTLQPILAAP